MAGTALAAGCSATQAVPIECVPEDVIVYVDGELLEEMPEAVELTVDEPHTLLFKGEGYRPELVVLETSEADGVPRLSPENVCVNPVYVGMGRQIEVEIEEDGASP